MKPCVSDLFPQAAIHAMVHESGAPKHDDGHTDCYYAGLLLAALPHLTPEVIAEACAFEEERAMNDHPGPPQIEWPNAAAPDRLAPRECIGKAQEEMNKAWCAGNYYEAMQWVRSSVDWLRRALEQMAPTDEENER